MSYGEQLLEQYLRLLVSDTFQVNYRPEWLAGLELDFYYPDRRVGFEFQGDHHYAPTDYSPNYKRVRRNDVQKKRICKANGVLLLTIDAVDLEYTRLRSKIKIIRAWCRAGLDKKNVEQLRRLNKESTQYRKTLRTNFDAATAMRRANQERKRLIAERRLPSLEKNLQTK